MLSNQQVGISAGNKGQKQDRISLIADLVGTPRKQNQWNLATLADQLQAVIQLAVDQQTAAYKKLICAAPNRQINDLIQFSKTHLIRIDQDSQFFLALLLCPGQFCI